MRKVTQEEFNKIVEDGDKSLISLDLSGLDLTKAAGRYIFYDCRIAETRINTKIIWACKFIGCNFYKSVFTDCVFENVTFIMCRLVQSQFKRCKIEDSKFLDSALDYAVLSKVLFSGECNFIATDLDGVEFTDCNMEGALFDSCISAHAVEGIDLFQFHVGRYSGHYSGGHLSLGCKKFPINYWLENYEEIGEEEGLEEEEIELYGTIIKYIANLYPYHAESIPKDKEESDRDLIGPSPFLSELWDNLHISNESLLGEGKPLESIAHPTEAISESKADEDLTEENLLKAIENIQKWKEEEKQKESFVSDIAKMSPADKNDLLRKFLDKYIASGREPESGLFLMLHDWSKGSPSTPDEQ